MNKLSMGVERMKQVMGKESGEVLLKEKPLE
jgi:hypothetical protein